MRVACVNYHHDPGLASPATLLDRYETLTGYAGGLRAAGAAVTVVQQFGIEAQEWRDGVCYAFATSADDDCCGSAGNSIARRVAAWRPNVIHIHGLPYAGRACGLKRASPRARIVVQDHAERPPRSPINRLRARLALRCVDAVSYTVAEHGLSWRRAGCLPSRVRSLEIMEGSSRFHLQSRAETRAETGLSGAPVCLWVGRLNANKDPIAVLRGWERAREALPDGRLFMVYGSAELEPQVRRWLAARPEAAKSIVLMGSLPHASLEAVYNSADILVLGSHREGSGYAVLEALACGVAPVLTDIPSFRALTSNGQYGALWRAGNAVDLSRALRACAARITPETPAEIRRYFEARWSFDAIGRAAFAAYAALIGG